MSVLDIFRDARKNIPQRCWRLTHRPGHNMTTTSMAHRNVPHETPVCRCLLLDRLVAWWEPVAPPGLCSLPRRLRRTTSLRAGLLLAVCSFDRRAQLAWLLAASRPAWARLSAAGRGLLPVTPAPGRTGASAVLRPACGRQGTRPAARRGVREASGSAGDSRVRGGASGDATGKGALYFLYSWGGSGGLRRGNGLFHRVRTPTLSPPRHRPRSPPAHQRPVAAALRSQRWRPPDGGGWPCAAWVMGRRRRLAAGGNAVWYHTESTTL